MKNKFIRTTLSVSLMATLMPFNALANFSSPFDDPEEKPLLFAEESTTEKARTVSKSNQQKAESVRPQTQPVRPKAQVAQESSLVFDTSGEVDELESAKEKLAAIKRETIETKRLAAQKELEVKALEQDLVKKSVLKKKEEQERKLQAERLEKERIEALRAEELKKARLEKERIEHEFQEKQRLAAEKKRIEESARLNKIKAEALAKVRAEEEAKLRLAAEAEARKKVQAELKAEAERKAKEAALKADAERKAKEAELKAEAERKAKEAAIKADAERKAKEAELKAEAERKAKEAAIKADAERKAKEGALKVELERKAEVNKKAMEAALKADAERKAKDAAAKVSQPEVGALANQPVTTGITIGRTYANRATQSALQKATAKIAIDPSKMPLRNRVLGFTASKEQIESLNDRYKYDPSRMSIMPDEVGEIKLLPVIRLTGDTIALFATSKEKQLVEEYLSYHPLHSQVFSNYVTRVITMNEGQTGGLTVDKALMEELTYNFATTPVHSSTLSQAQDQYLYITNRLTDVDQIKFWNWVNTVKTGDTIKVPSWIGLADVMYSQ